MRARFQQLLDDLRTSFWFVPSLMLGLSAVLALFLLHLDTHLDPGMKAKIAWAYTGGPEGARSLLSTVAGSMITAASVTFSLASVALSIASQQYGSRVLRNFMRDRITQVLLGTFVSTFLYSVLVVRDIRGSDYGGGFVPGIAITGAIALSLVSLLMLVYFVHHVSSSIQASHIVSTVAEDLAEAVPKLYGAKPGNAPRPAGAGEVTHGKQHSRVGAPSSGYLQAVDTEGLVEAATKRGGYIEVRQMPGDYMVAGGTLADVWAEQPLGAPHLKDLAENFAMGGKRVPAQDIRYQLQQLTDVTVRALSPGINDPFTAITAIDALSGSLALIARSPRRPELQCDEAGTPRLRVPHPTLEGLLRETVGHIQIYAASDSFVMGRLRRVLDIVEPDLRGEEELGAVQQLRRELDRHEREAHAGS